MPSGIYQNRKIGGFSGKKHTEAAKKKMSEAKKKKPLRYWLGKKRSEMSAEKHFAWKGDDCSYAAKHIFVAGKKGKPSKCEHCGTTSAKRYEWANISRKYKREVSDYIRLCQQCHKKYDKGLQTKVRQQR